MILLIKKKRIFNIYLYNVKTKYKYNIFYLKGYFGIIKIYIYLKFLFINNLKQKLLNGFIEINNGWINILFLNGLGFKATKKYIYNNNKYWRFNVGHSHVFQYFTPKNIILKSKNRYICIFGYKKNQIIDISEKIKKFHIPDIYKGVGIKYPDELIKLKKGKVRQ